MIDIIETVLGLLNIECYYISPEGIIPEGDYIIYNFKDKGEVYASNNVVKKEYTVYINYYIADRAT